MKSTIHLHPQGATDLPEVRWSVMDRTVGTRPETTLALPVTAPLSSESGKLNPFGNPPRGRARLT
jgi:hypothetical protein